MKAQIRPEAGPADAAAIEAVTIAAFLNAPHTDHSEQHIVAALRAAGALSVSLLAELGGAVVGHVAASAVMISDGSPGWFGLGPLSVLPACQGRGLGSQLMHGALEALRADGAAGCVLLGDPAYYGRFGFRPEPGLRLAGVPPEYFQALRLAPQRPLPQGLVSYHEAFMARG